MPVIIAQKEVKMHQQPLNEISLLSELSHEISNFSEKFKGKAKHTYILSPFASSLFSFNIMNDRVYVGVPEEVYELLIRVKWYTINLIDNRPGVFLIFDIGENGLRQPAAIRVFLREKQVKAISQFKTATFIRCDPNGSAFNETSLNSFNMPIRMVTKLDWENIKILTKTKT